MAKEHSKGKEGASLAPIEGNILPYSGQMWNESGNKETRKRPSDSLLIFKVITGFWVQKKPLFRMAFAMLNGIFYSKSSTKEGKRPSTMFINMAITATA